MALVSAKKIVGAADLTAAIDPSAGDRLVVRWQRPIDRYPFSYTKLSKRVKSLNPSAKPSQINKIIKKHGVKEDQRFSYYNFAMKEHEERYVETGELPKVITSLYNEDAVQFILAEVTKLNE